MITEDYRYQAETIPPTLEVLGSRLAAFFGVSPNNVGMKGDAEHRGGYHRSRRFLTSSPYSRDRHYSVTDSPGNRGGNPDWICAIDISLEPGKLIPMCQRLSAAVRSGRFEKVAEWYGNDGNNRVDGYDNIRNVVASSDPSHLWHAHIGLIRSHAGDDHSDLYDVLTGQNTDEEDDVDQKTADGILRELTAVNREVTALNEFVMTGKRYGNSGTAPPDSQYIGVLLREIQLINSNLGELIKAKKL